MIYLGNIRSALRMNPEARSIAIQDENKPGALTFLMPTWDMVGGLKAYQGIETKIRHNGPISYEEYIERYRQLLLVERRAQVRAWVASLQEYNDEFHHLHLYCYCSGMPGGFPAHEQITPELCERWFCHRWLVYKLLRSWGPVHQLNIV